MNFVGKFDGSLPLDEWGAHRQAQVQHIESSATHVPADAIIVPDAHLLFEGDYKRSGVDLILSNDERELVLHDYFKGEKRAALSSPDGAHLTGDIVNALSGGHVQYAQAAGTPAAAEVIGHVTKITGTAEAVRNGVSIILNQGDNVEKGDVIQSGSNSTVGVTFVDGSVFGLSSNARMVLNEMIYDPKGSNNSSLISLVAGTISFVAGETAKHGDMKVDTPVATMGIRGTAVLVEIDFSVPGQNGTPSANFQVLVEPDGSTGSYILFDKQTLAPIATVNQAGQLLSIHDGAVSVSNASMTPDIQKLINDVFTQKFTDNSNQNTKTATNFTDTLTPQYMPTITLADKTSATPVVLFVNTTASTTGGPPPPPPPPIPHVPQAPTVNASSDGFVEHLGVTGGKGFDGASGFIRFVDINAGDQPTASAKFDSFTYQNAHQTDITANLTATELAAIKAVEIPLSIIQDPANINVGSASWSYSLADGAFDFLGKGETLTLTYYVTVSNNYSPLVQTTTVPITVTITGTNDVPVITSNAPATIAFSGGTSVPGGDLTTKVPTSGTIKFDDPDLTDTHKVSVALESAVMDGSTLPPTPMGIFEKALTVSLGTDSTGTGLGTVNWKLADLPVYLADFIPKGKTLTLTYAVTVTDSQGATATQDVTVTITGTDTPAVVWIATAATGSPPGGLWSDASNWETGTVPTANDDVIIITDQLSGLTPSYPVTINAAAVAKSVTMDDFGAPPPELINESTLTIGGLMEVLDNSVLRNSGTIKLKGGGDFKDHSSITNTSTGLIEIVGGMLNVQVDITNAGRLTVDAGAGLTFGTSTVTNTGGTITVDGSGTMTLNGATIDGGTINDYSLVAGNVVAGLIDVTGSSVISNAHLNNGQVRIESNLTLTLDDVTVVGTSFADTAYGAVIQIDGDTTLDGTTVTGGAITDIGTINIDANKTLKLSGVALSGGSIANSGTIEITGTGSIENDALGNTQLTIDSGQTLTLDGTTITGGAITDIGTINIDAHKTLKLSGVALSGGSIANSGTIEISGTGSIENDALGNTQLTIDGGQTLTLDGATITGGAITDSGTINIDAHKTLKLSGVALSGGSITNSGTIEITGTGSIENDALGNTQLTVDGGQTLTLDGTTITGGSITNSGTIEIAGTGSIENDALGNTQLTIDGGQTLTLDGTTITGGAITDIGTINIDANKTLKLSGVALSGGSITNSGTIEITGTGSIENDALGNTQLTIDSGQTLTLDGTTVTGGSITDSGTINIDAHKTLKLSGVALSGGSIANSGTIEISGTGSIENDALGNTQLTIDSGQTLTLDGTTITGGTVASAGATLNVDAGTTLTFQGGATVIGGTLSDFGTVDIEGSLGATFDGVTVTGSGTIQVDDSQSSTPLVLQDATSITSGKFKIGPVGTLAIKTAGGATLNDVEITNGGSIEVFAGSVLILDHLTTVTNTGGTISIDGTAMLTLDDATISGGIINDYSLVSGHVVAGDIDVTGSSRIEDSSLHNGDVTIASGQTLTLDGVTATGTSLVDTADGATIQIDLHDTLTLNDVSIHGGTINDYNLASGRVIAADIDITGSSTIDNVSLNHGHVDIEAGQTLTLDNVRVTGTWFTDTADGATIQVDGGTTLTLNDVRVFGGTINDYSIVSESIVAGEIEIAGSSLLVSTNINYGDVTIDAGQTLTLFGGIYTGTSFDAAASGATIQVDAVTALTLNDVSITGGTINDHGPNQFGVDAASYIIVDGSSKISDASLNDGHVITQMQQTLTLDNVIVTGTAFVTGDGSSIQVDGGTTLTLNDVSITGGIVNDYSLVSGQVVAGKIDVTGSSTISGASLNHGDVTIEDGQTLTLANVKVNDTTITFAGNGTLDIEQPSAFSGKIAGISGKGDVIDLGGFDAAHDTVVASTGRGSYDSATNTTSLVVTDETTHHSVTLKLVGDYSDSTWNVTGDGHGGADIVDPPAPAAIASGASFQIASAEDVSFHSSTGDLLDPASDFTVVVSGFTGKGTPATSDQIDLKGIDDHSGSFTESYDAANDTLSVSDGTHSASLHFAGSYQAANFNFTSDGHGGTIVYDPPVPGGDGQGHTPATQAPVVASGQGFVFNFNGAQLTGAPHLVDSVSLAKVESTLNKLSEGPSGSVVTSDAHDFLAPGIVKAQLHTHDFHFV